MSDNNLPGLGVDPKFITIAGFSSGSANSMNVHIAHSKTIKGAMLSNGAASGHSFVAAEAFELVTGEPLTNSS